MLIKRNIYVTTLAIATTTVGLQAHAQDKEITPLSDWNYEDIYEAGGIRADKLMDAEVFGDNEEEIGSVENVLLTQDNNIAAIIAQVGGLWDIGDTHVLVPWENIELHEGGVKLPVTEDNVDEYGLFASDEYITEQSLSQTQQVDDDIGTGSDIWKLTDVLDDYASVGEGVGYGYIDNILFSRNGEIQGVVVDTDSRGPYAFPFYGYGHGWAPSYATYSLQYDEDEIGEMQPFDYERYESLLE
ncbi:PRC-barrel domain-containing protein [Vreelandella sulfidaeris]